MNDIICRMCLLYQTGTGRDGKQYTNVKISRIVFEWFLTCVSPVDATELAHYIILATLAMHEEWQKCASWREHENLHLKIGYNN